MGYTTAKLALDNCIFYTTKIRFLQYYSTYYHHHIPVQKISIPARDDCVQLLKSQVDAPILLYGDLQLRQDAHEAKVGKDPTKGDG